jgi:hypothetical protein
VTLQLAEPEARSLAAFCRRQLRWDGDLPVRIVSAESAIGMFTAPPLGVLAFVAVPLAAPIETPLDVTVRLADWAELLEGSDITALDPGSLRAAMVPVTPGVSVRDRPPSDGWQVPIFAVSGDLVPMVTAATTEYEARSVGLMPRGREQLAKEIWDRPAWAGLPMRALHAARQLGMLTDDRARVSAATCGTYKRLSTMRGQVFVPVRGTSALLTLRLDR